MFWWFLAFGCPKQPAAETPAPPAPTEPAPPPVPAFHPDEDPACEAVLRDLRAAWSQMHTAADAQSPTKKLAELLPSSPAACRGGTWHLLAGRAIREKAPVETGFASMKDALAAGLAAEPTSGPLLAFVAYGQAAAPDEFPALPADACDRARGDDRAYVCGMVALRETRWADAANLFDQLADPTVYPDGNFRKKQAYQGALKPPPEIRVLPVAEREVRCAKFGATPAECSRLGP